MMSGSLGHHIEDTPMPAVVVLAQSNVLAEKLYVLETLLCSMKGKIGRM